MIIRSSEPPEIPGVSDRIYVTNDGRIVGEFPRGAATQEGIMKCIMQSIAEDGSIDLSVGSVVAFIGTLVMGVLNSGMSILGMGSDAQQIVKGLALLIAVAFDVISKKKAR